MFYQYQHPVDQEQITVCGIPFSVVKNENDVVQKIWYHPVGAQFSPGSMDEHLEFHTSCDVLFFLGMSTDTLACSEWWGLHEAYHDYSYRIFIGDRLMQIRVIYEGNTEETIPVIFGVNAWNYGLYYGGQEKERLGATSAPFTAPYQEPFASDPDARALKDASLKMMENTDSDAEKCTKFVFAYKLMPGKTIKEIILVDEGYKRNSIVISAVTGLLAGQPADPSWTVVDQDFFLKREYYADMYRLAHRLYQFREDIPAEDPKKEIEGFDAPDITFGGAALADIYTNVYRVNTMDMAYGKVDDNGNCHTSTPGTANFGCYIGFGTFNKGHATYSDQIWTRDLGRTLAELTNLGYFKRVYPAAEYLHKLLYYHSIRYPIPHWKRVANILPENEEDWNDGKENDGHASIMLFIYTLYRKGGVDKAWLLANRQQLKDAAEYYIWQMMHPDKSNFNGVLCSESEASSQYYGGYDLFSNVLSSYALLAYSRLFEEMGDAAYALKIQKAYRDLYTAAHEQFTMFHPRYGNVLADSAEDCWTYEYKRMADLLIYNDVVGYDMAKEDPELFDLLTRTFLAQKEVFYAPESGRQMGYGQGYLTQSVIMLDLYEELTDCIEAAAMFCYHHSDCSYIVPEGVIVHGSKQYWFRNSDQGNAVQQAEIVKCARLLLGIDDIMPKRGLRLIPRLPLGWSSLQAEEFPVALPDHTTVPFSFSYTRGTGKGKVTACDGTSTYTADWKGDVNVEYIRMGPFQSDQITVTGAKIMEIRKIQNNYFAYTTVM